MKIKNCNCIVNSFESDTEDQTTTLLIITKKITVIFCECNIASGSI